MVYNLLLTIDFSLKPNLSLRQWGVIANFASGLRSQNVAISRHFAMGKYP